MKELWNAIRENDLNKVQDLLKTDPQLANAKFDDEEASSPLFLAIRKGYLPIVELLLKQGIDINIFNNISHTPLIAAITHGHTEIAKFLIVNGADVNKGNASGLTPIHMASWNGPVELVALLIERGANINSRYYSWFSAPYHAVYKNDIALMKLLLEKGADVNTQFDNGDSLLHLAVSRGLAEMTAFLLKAGADINAKSRSGATPLIMAILNGAVGLVELLVSGDADVNIVDESGTVPLIEEIKHRHTRLAGLMLEKGANPNQLDRSGAAPLHFAAEKNDINMAERLISGDADVNIKDFRGNTALSIALREGYQNMADLLTGKGAKPARAVARTQKEHKPAAPAIIWFSDPVRPNETVVLQGYGFADNIAIEVRRLSDRANRDLEQWQQITPLQKDGSALKFALPGEWTQGVFACRVTTGNVCSNEVLINAPDPWWMQGDLGIDGSPGGWLRIFGKCLNFKAKSTVRLAPINGGKKINLKAKTADCYSLKVELPAAVIPGRYKVLIHNGHGGKRTWIEAGAFRIHEDVKRKQDIFNVIDFGADPYNDNDATCAVNKAIDKARTNGGGIVYFPRGRYRITSMLEIPPDVMLKGEGMGLVNLWWPDRQEDPLPSLIKGAYAFAVEDLSLYTQGVHHNVILGGDDVKIRRVRIRAYWLFCLIKKGSEHHGRRVDAEPSGAGIVLAGKNIEITDCDIYHSCMSLELSNVRGGLVARNQLQFGSYFICYCAQGLIFENNECNCSGGSGGGVSLYGGDSSCRYVYYAHNTIRNVHYCDRETMTLDGHGTAYLGGVIEASGHEVILRDDPYWGTGHKDMIAHWRHTTLFVLDGKGAGQYRWIKYCEGRRIEIDRPWDVPPDTASVVSIGRFNGRHIFVGNTVLDAGAAFQLYPPNIECIVADNQAYRTGNCNSGGQLSRINDKNLRVEPSWFNQFIGNEYVEGNGWGGGTAVINGWIGGGARMNVYGLHTDPAWPFPISRCQIVRRHICANNSSILIEGSVDNALVESCRISENRLGIEINAGVGYHKTESSAPEKKPAPGNVLLRNNEFISIDLPYSGDCIDRVMKI